ncbi:DNA-binding CsgD family transcriptional regulator [Azospirillum lipoferum]|uniref:Helix-turn-helix transcriptional regulator n=1 Tax=Azospirillum lipoferum TaxID=193 RepID=A0A5A9GD76_AZOLI|nr:MULTISPECIES: LuxR C-terminal-related transcriptional regulator [Azospirillum]KAA0592346.1 helix-turn-helix transcriptional regulator [Azospirillum lipoferum]MCP1614626.1 DNA-binding CsgD family transcriptional regulator [Azospirillum lipoferum]MDW5532543.1 LuxR C-terminal-related transcriptional regulator [Azospirillum sp. NL1]
MRSAVDSAGEPGAAPPFADWNDAIARAVSALGTPGFPAALEAALQGLVTHQMMNGFHYSPDGRAFDLHNDRPGTDRRIIVDQYLAGTYVLDPFYDASRHPDGPPFIVMRKLAPDDFEQSEYFRLHYAATRIVDEVGFRLTLDAGHVGILSLCRVGEAARFSIDELARLEAAASLVRALGERHWHGLPNAAAEPAKAGTPRRIEHPLLTNRELEVVTLILKGHSTQSIAAVLSLSPDTVKVHRRRIYAKLRISSQGELFRTFLTDPLISAGPR